LYGAKGAGKSELMKHLANDEKRKADVMVNVTCAESKNQILSKVMQALLYTEAGSSGRLFHDCIAVVRNKLCIMHHPL
jgi:predicted AAA+ superfamily ATPase